MDMIDFYGVCGYGGCLPESVVTEDVMLLSLHFRCLGQGSSQVMIMQDAEIECHLALLSGKVQPPAFAVTCNQYSSHAAPVGGFIEPVNKLSVFAPYLALFGFAATVAVVVWKKREN